MSLVDRRLLGEVRYHPLWLGLTIGLNLAGSLTAIAQAAWLSWVIGGAFFRGYSLEKIQNGLTWLFALILLRSVLVWGGQTTASKLAILIKANFRQKLYDHLCALGPAALRRESTGEIIHLLTEGVEALDAYFSQYLPQLFLAVSTPLLILAFVFPQDALSGFVLLITAPLIPLFMVLIGNRANQLTQRQWSLLSRLSAYFLDILQGLTTLKVLGYSREQAANLEQANERYRKATMGVLKVSFLSALSLEMISTLSTAILAVTIGLRLLAGKMIFEPSFFILVIAPEFYLPLRMLGVRFHASMAGSAVSERLFELLETKAPRKTASEGISPRPLEPPEIRFEHVYYTYPDGRNALRDLSFTLAKGKVTALVGPSGAGKSTVAGLLLGFLTPSSGKILVNGKSLPSSEGQHGMPVCAWVPQAPFLFQDTVLANIRLGEPSATLEQVQEAARLAHADSFIQELPDGYETLIGERGQRLSSGQAQRIALARAFLRNAQVLILDEPTSSLDPESENLIREAVQRLAENRTVLVIAHRLNTTAQADQIVVLEEGKVIEQGRHAELIAKGGIYARLAGGFPIQSSLSKGEKNNPILADPSPGRKGETASLQTPFLLREQNSTSNLALLRSQGTKFSTLLRLFRLLRPFAGWMALSILAGFLTVSSSVGLMSTSAFIITLAALRPSIADLQVAIVGVRFFGISRGVFRYLERLISHETTFRVLAKLRTWFYLKVEPLAPAIFLKFHSGDIFTRLHADLSSLESFFVRSAAPPLVALLAGLIFGIFLTRFHPSLAAIFIGFQISAGIGLPLLVFILGKRPGEKAVRTRAEFSRLTADGIQGMADLTAFGRIEEYKRQVMAAVRRLMFAQSQSAWISAMGQTLASGLAYLGMWAVLSQTIILLQQGQVHPLSLGVLALFALTSFEAVTPLPEAAQQMSAHLECARRLFEIAEAPSAMPDHDTIKSLPDRWDLRFDKVSFHYPGEHPFTLKNITFDLPQGKRLAIVGPSGSGKTTLLSLLMGFWEASEGKILLNGHDLRFFQKEILRRRWGVVWQQTVLFNTTLRENLRLAAPGASQSEIEWACEQAQLAKFIASLPQGYDTPIGEAGFLISGGERQRLAIARALLKNPPLLILDEPTANLDTATEKAILQMICALSIGRGLIMATHRLVGMETFDEILVMHKGGIVERGQHTALLAQGGYYAQLWKAQNQFLL